MDIPRKEYPRPQFVRGKWQNLNGEWQFEKDNAKSGVERGLQNIGVTLESKITVPFCPESRLSGINDVDFMYGVWYKKKVVIKSENELVKLHFGAADYHTFVFVNGKCAGDHTGGYVSFEFDITSFVVDGENEIAVYCEDDTKAALIPSGKQSMKYESYGCHYTRTTGIWQTVWLEYVPVTHIKKVRFYPCIEKTSVTVICELEGKADLETEISFEKEKCGTEFIENASGTVSFTVNLSRKELWEIGNGRLYDVVFKFGNDFVKSYFGLREIRNENGTVVLNGKKIFQRLVFDQGFYPDGIYTAPTDFDLKNDIILSMNAGFDGARLHEKIFEERFLYHADRLGYIVWGEYPNWGLDHSDPMCIYSVIPEWTDEIERDFNHPCIIGWCPFNETWDVNGRKQYDKALEIIYELTKKIDNTRPCIDTSGNFHVRTDIYDLHDYTQDPGVFRQNYADIDNMTHKNAFNQRQRYKGGSLFISEYGGIAWKQDENGWGYGNGPKTEDEFFERLNGLNDVLLSNPRISGFCYTQLTDVEQEQNGIYTYERKPKFDISKVKAAFARKSVTENKE